MQFEELRFVCQSAAIDLAAKRPRPLPPTIVLPGAERTRLLTLSGFPTDDEQRHTYVAELAHDEVRATEMPCWGFIAEAEADAGEDGDAAETAGRASIVVVVYGARRHAPELTASRFGEHGELEEFVPAEELDPTAMPFLHPLQHAVDQLPAADSPDATSRSVFDDPGSGGQGGLPIIG